jgi:hypothetical protein
LLEGGEIGPQLVRLGGGESLVDRGVKRQRGAGGVNAQQPRQQQCGQRQCPLRVFGEWGGDQPGTRGGRHDG